MVKHVLTFTWQSWAKIVTEIERILDGDAVTIPQLLKLAQRRQPLNTDNTFIEGKFFCVKPQHTQPQVGNCLLVFVQPLPQPWLTHTHTHTHTHTQTCTHAHNYGQWLNCLSRGGGSLDFRPVLKGNTMISIHERQTTYRHVIGMHFCKIHIKGHKIMLQRDVLAIKQQDRNKIYCNQHRCQSILTTTSRSHVWGSRSDLWGARSEIRLNFTIHYYRDVLTTGQVLLLQLIIPPPLLSFTGSVDIFMKMWTQ